jgi:hypothetical protein
MEDLKYETWWKLHERAVRGETLNHDERAAYEAGLRELHEDEVLSGDLALLREAREAVMQLDAKCDALQAQRRKLKDEAARLESVLSKEARKLLGIEE